MLKFLLRMVCISYVLGAVGMEAKLVAEDWSEGWTFDSDFKETMVEKRPLAMAWPSAVAKDLFQQ
jgi:hypothetical protein